MKKIQLGGHKKSPKTGKKEIRGYALVDNEDYEWLNQWKWSFFPRGGKRGGGYAVRKEKKSMKVIFMHREVLELNQGEFVDHINNDGFDNRKRNLRVANHSQNGANIRCFSDNKSGRKGVHWHKGINKWIASIRVNKQAIHLGSYLDFDKAVSAREQAEKKYFGDFAFQYKLPTK